MLLDEYLRMVLLGTDVLTAAPAKGSACIVHILAMDFMVAIRRKQFVTEPIIASKFDWAGHVIIAALGWAIAAVLAVRARIRHRALHTRTIVRDDGADVARLWVRALGDLGAVRALAARGLEAGIALFEAEIDGVGGVVRGLLGEVRRPLGLLRHPELEPEVVLVLLELRDFLPELFHQDGGAVA